MAAQLVASPVVLSSTVRSAQTVKARYFMPCERDGHKGIHDAGLVVFVRVSQKRSSCPKIIH
jgi:hypothetical protein